jgi:hypothetical protein
MKSGSISRFIALIAQAPGTSTVKTPHKS